MNLVQDLVLLVVDAAALDPAQVGHEPIYVYIFIEVFSVVE